MYRAVISSKSEKHSEKSEITFPMNKNKTKEKRRKEKREEQ